MFVNGVLLAREGDRLAWFLVPLCNLSCHGHHTWQEPTLST